MSKRRIATIILISAGTILIITAAVLEYHDFPWDALFSRNNQSWNDVADPQPVNLEDGETITSNDNQEPAEDTYEGTVLPGQMDENSNSTAPSVFEQLGILKIPVINVSAYIFEDTQKQLKYGVGHIIGTDAIGQEGNCAIAGHNYHPFRHLNLLKEGDNIIIKTAQDTYTYTVYDSFTVQPQEVWVLENVKDEDYVLTLLTCTPYPASTHRLVVRARLIKINDEPLP